MSMNTLGGVLDQIQSQARQVSDISALNPFNATRKTESSSQFSNILLNSINNISGMQTFAKQQSQAYLTGAEGIGLNDVMVSIQKSSVALNLGVQVRNKLVSAYQEIMSMPV
ncbi:flagellar hook-basal body complex protein FliE [Kosakonia cowanii]|jgi:flagellar hook-basal body complex protein FliE|uniref:Flagellar hook-basal body complex protein FliE n=1 Tax=Kosakonia cowanii JCM 10956 = DSM 18146 TaxID=1300165 RepID=A0A807LET8_9ENTR|nr:flagellar hook-basal body complex protein FliE [Kosakonia cowanii]APZ04408.1 flagellar hook-basal body complex protein FliE [Kosakonia cowanii JCM 10956 = DSM 18146]MDM9616677.1 flagellar hook-basal body complex protein FliE [Kosakonia cowanii]MDP4561682.1 flagellar hook-basal body complex protein FliE [Kosakonia cowanii]WPG20019.1 flagellar hook-basal body complex protein FliE [Kosakonia cowanii]WRY58603.1 flagellar hook-basal body complex protein FliE [Kosakonia cowanii]